MKQQFKLVRMFQQGGYSVMSTKHGGCYFQGNLALALKLVDDLTQVGRSIDLVGDDFKLPRVRAAIVKYHTSPLDATHKVKAITGYVNTEYQHRRVIDESYRGATLNEWQSEPEPSEDGGVDTEPPNSGCEDKMATTKQYSASLSPAERGNLIDSWISAEESGAMDEDNLSLVHARKCIKSLTYQASPHLVAISLVNECLLLFYKDLKARVLNG